MLDTLSTTENKLNCSPAFKVGDIVTHQNYKGFLLIKKAGVVCVCAKIMEPMEYNCHGEKCSRIIVCHSGYLKLQKR
jgi:hypothetical protein